MAGRRIVYLATLLGCLVFYYFYREWFSWFALTLVFLLPFLSLALSLPAILTTRYMINSPDTVPLGQSATVAVSFSGPLPAPPFRGKLRVTHKVTGQVWIMKKSKTLPTNLCGQLRIDVVKPRFYDYLGLIRLPVRHKSSAVTYIWPEPVPLTVKPEFLLQAPQRWKPKPGGGFSENHELRLYRPGDNLQQLHWKLSAKTGKLILREAMEPIHKPIRLTLDLRGSSDTINRKLGNLLWVGNLLCSRGLPFEIAVLADEGALSWHVTTEETLISALRSLLACSVTVSGSIREISTPAYRQFHIGGEDDEG